MYKFFLPVKIIFGAGSLSCLGEEVSRFGKKVLLVCGRKSVKETGTLQKIERILKDYGIAISIYDNIPPEPSTEVVSAGLEILQREQPDCVIGIGGGSVIDVAKAVAGLYGELMKNTNNFEVESYLEVDGTKKVETPGLPFVAVPTVAGTGAEVTMNSVLVNPKTNTKRSIRSEHFFAKLAIIDPELTLSVPPDITVIASIDALCHLVEGYISKKSNLVCDGIAVEGIKYIIDNLPTVVKDPYDLPAREKISVASLYGGIMIVNSGLTLAHGIGGVVGARFKLPHGFACGVSLPEVLEYNLQYVSSEKQRNLKNIFGEHPKVFLQNFYANVGFETQITVKQEIDFTELAQQILSASSTKGNPKDVSLDEVVTILNKLVVKNL